MTDAADRSESTSLDAEQVADLRERLETARTELRQMGEEYPLRGESRARLFGKAEGVGVALEYLRLYA